MAPPSAAPPPSIPPVQRRSRVGWVLGGGALALLGGWALFILPAKTNSKSASRTLAFRFSPPSNSNPATKLPADPPQGSGGLFKVTPQADKNPAIDVVNDTPDELCLQIEDQNGQVLREWIDPAKSIDFTLPQGEYSAWINAPDDPYVRTSDGSVSVQEFHHYSADFSLTNDDQPSSFYIGD